MDSKITFTLDTRTLGVALIGLGILLAVAFKPWLLFFLIPLGCHLAGWHKFGASCHVHEPTQSEKENRKRKNSSAEVEENINSMTRYA